MTCWRRLERWTEAGVFDQVHQLLLAKLNAANRIDWTRAAMDGITSTPKGGAGTGPSPVNRGKPGSKHHLICDGNGTPIYVLTSGANVPDISRAAAGRQEGSGDERPADYSRTPEVGVAADR
jgi:hypothetical protein